MSDTKRPDRCGLCKPGFYQDKTCQTDCITCPECQLCNADGLHAEQNIEKEHIQLTEEKFANVQILLIYCI